MATIVAMRTAARQIRAATKKEVVDHAPYFPARNDSRSRVRVHRDPRAGCGRTERQLARHRHSSAFRYQCLVAARVLQAPPVAAERPSHQQGGCDRHQGAAIPQPGAESRGRAGPLARVDTQRRGAAQEARGDQAEQGRAAAASRRQGSARCAQVLAQKAGFARRLLGAAKNETTPKKKNKTKKTASKLFTRDTTVPPGEYERLW